MKVLCEKDKITDIEAENIFNKYVTKDYTFIEAATFDKDYEQALYLNKDVLKVETVYYPDEDLNYIKITKIPISINTINDLTGVKMKVVHPEIDFRVSYNHILTLIEGLVAYRHILGERDYGQNVILNARKDYQLNKINYLFEYFQDIIGYDYDGQCEDCMTRRLKARSSSSLGLGEDGITQLIKRRLK